VANVIQANLLAATVKDVNATGQAYNVACAESVTLNQLFQMMRNRLALQDPRFGLALPQYDDFRPGDIRYSCASIEKASRMLSFWPTHSVEQGLEEALTWYVDKAQATAGQAVAATPRHQPAAVVNPPHHSGTPLTLVAS
jgi:UDP-N-acetylglucosamine 4-epimerase